MEKTISELSEQAQMYDTLMRATGESIYAQILDEIQAQILQLRKLKLMSCIIKPALMLPMK